MIGPEVKLKPGDRVLIVSEAPDDNWNSNMDIWLGQIMTLERAFVLTGFGARMIEDNGRWGWDHFMIEAILSDDMADFEIADESEFALLLGGL